MIKQSFIKVVFIAILCWVGPALAKEFNIPDGDIEALNGAIAEANDRAEPAIINLAPGGRYKPDSMLMQVRSRIIINGRGSLIEGAEDWQGPRLFSVASSGSLVLLDLHLNQFEIQDSAVGTREGGIVFNSGLTAITRSTLSRSVHGGFRVSRGSAILNDTGAKLELDNVTLAMNESVGGFTKAGVIFNRGEVVLRSSTVTANGGAPGGIVNGSEGTTTLVNSIISGNEGADCEGDGFISLGHNIDSDGTCGLDQSSDQPTADARLGTFGDHGGLVDTVSLEPDSPALEAGSTAECSPVDARGFVRANRSDFNCDIGAFQLNAKSHAIEPALTASWFFPPRNGHGFNIEVLGPDRNEVLAYWYTYGAEGDPLWLLGVAPIAGHRAQMVLHQFEGMRFGSFDPADNNSALWGTLTLYFRSCLRGAATWQPLNPALPAGGMPLTRLTFAETLGCEN